MNSPTPWKKAWCVMAVVGGLAVVIGAPPLMIVLRSPFVSKDPYALFGCFATFMILALAWYFVRTGSPKYGGIFWAVFLFVMFVHLGIVTEFSGRSYDYKCYEDAAKNYLAGTNPYADCFIYPPPVVQCFAFIHQGCAAVAWRFAPGFAEPKFISSMVFYLYQSAQFFLVMALFLLLYRFSLRLGLTAMTSVLLVAVLLVLDNPLLRTIRFNQINLWILDAVILGILLLPRHAFLSGVILAVAASLKLYPAALFLPLLLRRNWKSLSGGLIGGAGVLLISTNGGTDWKLWKQFSSAIIDAESWSTPFRDNSLRGLFSNAVGLIQGALSIPAFRIGQTIYLVSIPVILVWFLIRISSREKIARIRALSGEAESQEISMIGHLVDMCALGLLVSPLVWEHHYVMALPLVVWALLASGSRQILAVIGVFLILAVPTFDFFPFSYHRLVGLVMLLIVSGPGEIPRSDSFSAFISRLQELFLPPSHAG
jgi:hypothetical protein